MSGDFSFIVFGRRSGDHCELRLISRSELGEVVSGRGKGRRRIEIA